MDCPQVADFSFVKRLRAGKTYTLCGTPSYLSPEQITRIGHDHGVDWRAARPAGVGEQGGGCAAGRLPWSRGGSRGGLSFARTRHPRQGGRWACWCSKC